MELFIRWKYRTMKYKFMIFNKIIQFLYKIKMKEKIFKQ